MKYLGRTTGRQAIFAASFGAFAASSGLSGCGGQGAPNGAADGASTRTLVVAAPTLSAAQEAARKKAAADAEAKRRLAEKKARLAREMRIEPWARGKVLRQVPVRKGNKVFALTFDDGPWPDYTRQILRILKEHDAKATFYMVGSVIREYPKLAREVHAAGHAIGNHSWDHPARPKDPVGQVTRTNAQIKKVMGVESTGFRPPYGIMASMARQAQREGQPVLLWSADSGDWSKPGASRIASRILNQATPGGIGLMHDGGGNRTQTVAALPAILRGLKARGYKLVTIPELIRHRYVAPKKPKVKPTAKASATAVAGSGG
jgi:peptidoglycan/xylan/chitin deacetylase (PgdA/CDA1 family)